MNVVWPLKSILPLVSMMEISLHLVLTILVVILCSLVALVYLNLFLNGATNVSTAVISLETRPNSGSKTWASSWQRPPSMPGITAGLGNGFCDVNQVHLSRVPRGSKGSTGWHTIMSVVHPSSIALASDRKDSSKPTGDKSWPSVPPSSIVLKSPNPGEVRQCLQISRATLMTLFALTNARPIFTYSSTSGHRSAYPSYCGQWSITWPMGKPCLVSLIAHDSHTAATDVYPPSFPMRVDKCVEMLAGVVTDGKGWKLAFPGRAKGKGPWRLRNRKKGLAGAHGQRHLWNMVGGRVWEVDLLTLVRYEDDENIKGGKLEVPCLSGHGETAAVFVTEYEQMLLARVLDCLPWTSLSWSMHRGMRDVLLAYGKPIMDRYRARLAATIKTGVEEVEEMKQALVKRGWEPEFVHSSMGDLAESSILSGGGNSGDLVRVVVAIVECLVVLEAAQVDSPINRDKTRFWAGIKESGNVDLDIEGLVALTKFFVLEWSQELDYQLYHELPVELYLT